MPSLVIRQMLLMILDLRSKNVRKVSHCCVDERAAVNVWQWMRRTARYFAASETLCEPQIHLKIESNRSEHKRRICATFSWLCASSSPGAQPRLSSAMYDCKVFNYSLPSKCVDKLLNVIARASPILRFHFIFNNTFVVWNKLIFRRVFDAGLDACKTSSYLVRRAA